MSDTRHYARCPLGALFALLSLAAGCAPPGGGFEEPLPTAGPCAYAVGTDSVSTSSRHCDGGLSGSGGGEKLTCTEALRECEDEAQRVDDGDFRCSWNGRTLYERDFPSAACKASYEENE
jgi:hypothetical protein